jgi:SPP1 gp7 family putative phage head morphogenesis protein
MATSKGTLRLLDQLHEDIANITDQQVRDLVKAYASAWDEVASDLDAALTEVLAAAKDGRVSRAKKAQSARLRRALAVISTSLQDLAKQAQVRVVGDLDEAIRLAGKSEVDLIRSMLPAKATASLVTSFDRVDDKAIAAIIKRSTQQIHARTRPIPADQVRVMKRELIRGVAVGDNPRETARRIMARTEGQFIGGAARATTIARTETLDAMRAGARAADRANKEVLDGWQWVADLSGRVCPACLAMHGSVHDVDDPGPLGHQNCRCARAPHTKSWADLGFKDLDEPADILPDAQAWFDGLLKADQKAILGADGLAAYTAGKFPMSAWATRKDTPGWRPSYVPASPPKP